AFAQLSSSLPYKILRRHSGSLFQLEALLFGQSGLLPAEAGDEYISSLKKEYDFLSKKYSLASVKKEYWRLLRLNPANFPALRISQFAALLHRTKHLFSSLTEFEQIKDLRTLLNVSASAYWDTHYIPGKKSSRIK